MEGLRYLSTVCIVAVSAICSWITAERTGGNILRTVAAGSFSAIAVVATSCAAFVLLRERPDFAKLSPMEEFAILTSIFGGAFAIVGIVVGCLCLIYRRVTANS